MKYARVLSGLLMDLLPYIASFAAVFLIARSSIVVSENIDNLGFIFNNGVLIEFLFWVFCLICVFSLVYIQRFDKKHFMIPRETKGVVFHKVLSKGQFCDYIKNANQVRDFINLEEMEMIIVSKKVIENLEANPCPSCYVFDND
ncbi:hypothetical protein I5M27_15810 [Adhaeribacter sp. BT258]|uniref:Uncharacterized protein n=1 Tax=Adhaeribacter terrigena TaxID=2793070 RepID=A0ABS1C7B1_9BACT|nr:hypothetical protein [Adhaeribacter terrigena]MBK0404465.1 hypothetical protein [Adhaeribacter terrigena]